MLADIPAADEGGRLSALKRSGLLDPDTDRAFQPITSLVRAVFDAPIAFVSTVGLTRQRYKCAIGLDVGEMPRDGSLCRSVIEDARIVVIEDAPNDPRFRDHALVTGPMGVRSYLGAPLVSADGYAIGTICIIDRKPRRIGAREIDLISRFAALVVEQTELLQLAERDALTGAWTRRAFLQTVGREMARARRYGEPASVALFDLDHFKRINDGFGHRTGDQVLQSTVAACEMRMREEETIGRLGGEEFAVLFAASDLPAAEVAAERLRKGIAVARLAEVPYLHFTASFGVAALTDAMARPEDWLEAADRALYRAKNAGRNRTAT